MRAPAWTVGALLLAACGGPAVGAPTPTTAPPPRLEVSAAGLTAGPLPDGTPVGPGRVVLAGGPLTAATVAGEPAVVFPRPCDAHGPCPKAVLEVPGSDDLSPGTGDWAWGARLLLRPDETSKGSNVLQRGFSVGGGGQWKLQVDGAAGHPSCTAVGLRGSAVHVVVADRGVADGRWHDVTCTRSGDSLTVAVDGTDAGRVALPAGLDVSPEGPVRLGGKNVKQDNDQLFGALARAWAGPTTG